MPTYDYQCAACGETYEVFQSMKDDPLTTCERCGKKGKVKRLLGTGAGIIFKGSGFYETDYKRADSGSGDSDTKGEGASDSGPKADKTDSKPAAKSSSSEPKKTESRAAKKSSSSTN